MENWLVGKGKSEHVALDYKVMIVPIGPPQYFIISSNPKSNHHDPARQIKAQNLGAEYICETQYFADNQFINSAEDDWYQVRRGVLHEKVIVTIMFQATTLKAIIEPQLQSFFFLNNFGTRQSKGFGSFTMEGFDPSHHVPSDICIYKKNTAQDWKAKIKTLSSDWKQLKAGSNFGLYYKSDLMKYFCKMSGIRWEKRKIKREIHSSHTALYNVLKKNPAATFNRIGGCSGDTDNPASVPASQNYKYIRAVLGLAEQFEFGKPGKPARVRVFNNEVKRFKAPVTFKVTNDAIYMICHEVPDLLSQNGTRLFSFDLSAEHNGTTYTGNLANLPIPTNFNVCHFLDSPWLGNNFEQESRWGNYSQTGITNHQTVAQHLNYQKINTNG
ncbi:MAG: hypothetical protein IPM26_15265 [Saprospiraceae bacterium]|nr:hypothetical protein [Saprospiraceae bacterium]